MDPGNTSAEFKSMSISLEELDQDGVKKWTVTKDGKKTTYSSYDDIPQDVKDFMNRRRSARPLIEASAKNSAKINVVEGKIKIEENGQTRTYDSVNDIPDKYKEMVEMARKMKAWGARTESPALDRFVNSLPGKTENIPLPGPTLDNSIPSKPYPDAFYKKVPAESPQYGIKEVVLAFLGLILILALAYAFLNSRSF